MGLFSSKSKSVASTSYSDSSTNMSVDFSTGDLSSGSDKNIIAGGNINYAGLSEDLASQVFGTVTDAFKTSLNWVSDAIGATQDQTKSTLEFVQQNNAQTSAQLQAAYNSEQATLSSLKTYAFYGLLAWVTWVYFKGAK